MNFQSESYEIDARSLRFCNPGVERDYIEQHNFNAVPRLRLVLVLLLGFVTIPLLVEYYGFIEEGFDGYEYYLGMLPYRLGIVALLLAGFGFTFLQPAIKRGQELVLIFSVLVFSLALSSNHLYSQWILLASMSFVFGLMLVVVACGLLYRYAAPLVLVATSCWVFILVHWLDNAFSSAFFVLATAVMLLVVAHAREKAERLAWSALERIAAEKKISESLLLNVLPASIADRMRNGESLIADKHKNVAVVFADIVNFTTLSEQTPPDKLVEILDDIFSRFDSIAERLNLEKIKTIGDAYMMAAGLPIERPINPALAAEAALLMREAVYEVNDQRSIEIDIRAGIHVGEVVAGVIGQSKFVYDLWGDVVNVASRMESTAPQGEIQVTAEMRDMVSDQFEFSPRGEIDVKGKGKMSTWILIDRKD